MSDLFGVSFHPTFWDILGFRQMKYVSQTKNLFLSNNRISIRLFIRPSIFKSDEKSDRFAAALTENVNGDLLGKVATFFGIWEFEERLFRRKKSLSIELFLK